MSKVLSRNLHNFHVPLELDLYNQLRQEAQERQKPATDLAREAIKAWLRQQHYDRIDKEIREYAAAMAGTTEDFDAQLEAVAWEEFQKESF